MAVTTPAILLRRIEFGEADLVVTLFTPDQGKISAVAKSAKKSVKRFPGVLELFSRIEVVLSQGRGKGMPILQEASLEEPFFRIRESMIKTAYASYWLEIVYLWMAENVPQTELYHLINHVLARLNTGESPVEVLSLLFQMRFLGLSGFRPNLNQCHACKSALDQIRSARVFSVPAKGGIACPNCGGGVSTDLAAISKGTLKQLAWMDANSVEQAARIRFTPAATSEGLAFLETFVPFHIGRSPKSLGVLRAVRAAMPSTPLNRNTGK
ncbi:DNA repair protein RecO [Desulfosarcina sp. OttesenSCG-928-G10]|nr:DNA repair protein RecO [Desulfosarcina sp. OttesenSCG-928-G10]MDL2321185.1 DNA repair protein RecO [Desulfosarcina sp. OttesenSCG-928-B08]